MRTLLPVVFLLAGPVRAAPPVASPEAESALGVAPSPEVGLVPVCDLATAVAAPGDPLRVHVVSVTPGFDLMSSMGHTVLLFSGDGLETPLAYNWGAFDATDDGLLWPFLRGTLPYYTVAVGWPGFWEANVGQSRTMIGQRLDLDPEAAIALRRLAERAVEPEHRVYRYHWGEANCATKVRDALDEVTGGALRAALDHPVDTTPRIEGSRHLWQWPPMRFAWRFMTSDRMDVPLTAWERTMVPEHLMRELGHVALTRPDGRRHPLVAETCAMHAGIFGWAPPREPTSPLWLVPGGLVAIAALGASRRDDARSRRQTGGIVAGYGLVLALMGTLSFALWSVSDLDGFGPTENWLLAGPQSWLLVWAGLRLRRARPLGRLRGAALALGALGVLCALLDLLPGVDQANGDILLVLLPGLLGCVAAVWRLGDQPPSRL